MIPDSAPASFLDRLEVLEPRGRLLRDLQTTEHGLSSREAARRLVQYGPNVLQALLGTAVLPGRSLLLLLPYPLIVWGADELRKYVLRHRAGHAAAA